MCVKGFGTLTPDDKRVVMALADANMNVALAGRRENYVRTTIVYHLVSVRTKTGLDPKNFHDLAQLVQMIEEERKEYERDY